MSCVVSLEAFTQLGEYIEQEIPELAGNVCPLPSEASHRLGQISMGIQPITFRYFPNQGKEWAEESYDTTVEEVGRHEVDCILQLNAPTMRQRAILQDKVVNLFLREELSPGVITLVLPNCWNAYASWELQSEEWESERVFDKKWYSTINVTAQLPALITRGGVYTIEDLQLGLLFDLEKTVSDFDTDADILRVSIDEDGNLTAT